LRSPFLSQLLYLDSFIVYYKIQILHMEIESSSDNPPEPPGGKLSEIVGTLIALITLLMPFFIIAHFSSAEINLLKPSPFLQSGD